MPYTLYHAPPTDQQILHSWGLCEIGLHRNGLTVWSYFSPFLLLQVDKVCGQPEERQMKTLPDNIVQVKEIVETPSLTMAHSTTLNNKRR